MVERYDPFVEVRNTWLRKKHRAPLSERAVTVFGDDGPNLLNDLREAYRRYESSEEIGFDRYARNILRRCGEITGKDRTRRREAYIKACVKRLRPPSVETDPEDILANIDTLPQAITALAKRLGISRDDAEQEAMSVAVVIHWRWDGNSTGLQFRVAELLINALSKKHPLKYLQKVKDEERKPAKRKRSS